MAERSLILDLQLNQGQLLQNLANAQKSVRDLRNEQKLLEKVIKETGDASGQFENELAGVTAQLDKERKALAGAKKDIRDYDKANNEATGSIVEMRGQLSVLTKQYDNLSKAERENIDIGGKLKTQIKDQSDALKKLEGETGRNQRNVGNYKEAISGLIGNYKLMGVSLNDAKGGLEKMRVAQIASTAATGGASKGLQLFKIALISTGIGAIVVVLGSLIAAFLSTQRGIDAVTKVMQPLQILFQRFIGFVQNNALGIFDKFKEAINNPKQALVDLGNIIRDQIQNRIQGLINLVTGAIEVLTALPKAITSGDFNQVNAALEKTADGFIAFNTGVEGGIAKLREFGEELSDTIDSVSVDAKRLNQIYDELNALNREQASDLAKLNVVIQENQLIARNQAKSLEERTKALANLKKAIEDKTAIEERNIELQIEQLELRQKQNDTSQEELEELDKLKASLIQLQAQRSQALRETLEIENTLRNEQKKLLADQLKAEQDALKKLQDIRFQNTLDSIKDEQERARRLLEIQNKADLESIEQLKVSEDIKAQLRVAYNEQFVSELEKLNEEIRKIELEKATADQLQLLQNQEAEFELRRLNAENLFEIGQLELEILTNKQQQELLLFKGSEEQKTLLIAEQTKQREQFAINFAKVQRDANLAVANSFSGLFTNIAKLASKNAGLQKAAALFQIGIDTAKGISGAIAQAQSVPFPANIAAIATGVGAVVSGIVQARQVLSATPTFAKGGELPAKQGGFITGRSHKQGGVKFAVGGQTMEAEGGEIIVNKNIQSRPDYVAAISQMNAATGGVDFYKASGRRFALGGTVGRVSSPVQQQNDSEQNIANTIANLPPIVVSVQDIINTTNTVQNVEVRSTIG